MVSPVATTPHAHLYKLLPLLCITVPYEQKRIITLAKIENIQ